MFFILLRGVRDRYRARTFVSMASGRYCRAVNKKSLSLYMIIPRPPFVACLAHDEPRHA